MSKMRKMGQLDVKTLGESGTSKQKLICLKEIQDKGQNIGSLIRKHTKHTPTRKIQQINKNKNTTKIKLKLKIKQNNKVIKLSINIIIIIIIIIKMLCSTKGITFE